MTEIIDWSPKFGFGSPRPASRIGIICIHVTVNTPGTPCENVARYQLRTQSGSYHELVNAGGRVLIENTDDWKTWSSGNWGNDIGWHLSFVMMGTETRAEWLKYDAMLRAGAKRCAIRAKKYGIPVVKLTAADLKAGKKGFCGHLETGQAWGGTDHVDPGKGFPWDVFLRYVREYMDGTAPAPAKKPAPAKRAEKVLDYPRGAVTQDTYYNCGPASCQTVIRSSTGKLVAENVLGKKLRTHTGGTDYIGQFPAVLNEYMPSAKYRHRDMPNDPPTASQKEQLWRDLVGSIDAGYGVVANIVAPPSNYPRSVPPSTQNLRYAGGTVYHYVAVMGYAGTGAGRRVWLADSGFAPYGAWIAFDQLATLIPPKGYAYATANPTPNRKETPVSSTRVILGGESAGALHEAKISSKNTEEASRRIEKNVTLIADQLLGWPKDHDGNYLISGWDFDSIVKSAEKKIADGKGITLVEQVAMLQKQNTHLAEAVQQSAESIGHLIDAFEAKVK